MVLAADVYRDFNTPGVPSSGNHNPQKAEIRQLLADFEAALGGGVSSEFSSLQIGHPTDTQLARQAAGILSVAGKTIYDTATLPPVSQAVAEAGTSVVPRTWSALRVKQAAAAQNPKFGYGAEQSTASGTEFDFTGIPVGTRLINIGFNGVSLNGSDGLLVQIGSSSGFEVTGYVSRASTSAATSGFNHFGYLASYASHGYMQLIGLNAAGTMWAAGGISNMGSAGTTTSAGFKVLAGELDRIRLTRTGANTFDGGSVAVSYR